MRAGRIEEADALAERIGTDITKQNSTRLRHINPRTSARDMWAAVRQVTMIMLWQTESLLHLLTSIQRCSQDQQWQDQDQGQDHNSQDQYQDQDRQFKPKIN